MLENKITIKNDGVIIVNSNDHIIHITNQITNLIQTSPQHIKRLNYHTLTMKYDMDSELLYKLIVDKLNYTIDMHDEIDSSTSVITTKYRSKRGYCYSCDITINIKFKYNIFRYQRKKIISILKSWNINFNFNVLKNGVLISINNCEHNQGVEYCKQVKELINYYFKDCKNGF